MAGAGTVRSALYLTALSTAYVLFAWLGVCAAFVPGNASPVWPPAGLAIAILVLGGLRWWPAVAIGAVAANILLAGNPLPAAAGIAVGNTLEAVLGALILRRHGVRGEVSSLHASVAILMAAALAPLPAASGGVLSLALAGFSPPNRYSEVWLVWWLGDFMGVLIVLPLLLAWASRRTSASPPSRPAECAGTLILAVALFSLPYLKPTAVGHLGLPLLPPSAFLFPPLVWAVLRLRPRETALVLAAACGLAIIHTLSITQGDPIGALLRLQMVLISVGGGTLLLTGAIAERTLATQTLQESEQRLGGIVRAAMDAVISVDAQQRIVLFNATAETMFRCPADAALGTQIERFIPMRFQSRHRQHVEAFFKEGTTARAMGQLQTLWARRDDGEEFPIEASISKVKVNGSRLATVIIREVTERKRLEEALHRMNEDLERRVEARTAELAHANEALLRSNQELQRFAFVASHDLQTPLRTITSCVQLLQRGYQQQLDEDGQDLIRRAVDGTHRIQALLRDLLAYSSIGSQPRPFQPVHLGQVCRDVAAALEAPILEAKAELNYLDNLPVVMGDRVQLTQLLRHLVENGIKYRSQKPPRLRISAEPQDDAWLFSVQDNGIGIAANQHERIFDIFARLHTPQAYPGTGIGLAVCRRVVESHGGRIWVESAPGQGSTFRFTLPRPKSEVPT